MKQHVVLNKYVSLDGMQIFHPKETKEGNRRLGKVEDKCISHIGSPVIYTELNLPRFVVYFILSQELHSRTKWNPKTLMDQKLLKCSRI